MSIEEGITSNRIEWKKRIHVVTQSNQLKLHSGSKFWD